MTVKRYQVRLDEATDKALERLSCADGRTKAAQLRHMIRTEAGKRGLWSRIPESDAKEQSR